MRITRVFEGTDGSSHLEELELPMTELGPGRGRGLEIKDVEGILLREPLSGEDLDFHNASRRQFVVHLSGGFEIDCGNGERRILKAGEILLGDDISGEGHMSREAVESRLELVIYLKPTFDIRTIGGDGVGPRP